MVQRIWTARLHHGASSVPRGRRRLPGVALSLALWACAPAEPAEIRIGVLPYVTGGRSETSGRGTIEGADLAVDELNARGGIRVDGRVRRIKLIYADAGQQEEIATRSARSLINQQHVIALIGPQFSRDAIPVAALAEAVGMPMISPMSSHRKTTEGRRWVFRLAFRNEFQGEVAARFARERLGFRRAAMLYDVTNDYSRDLASVFRREFEAGGGRIVADEQFTSDAASDFLPQLRRIQAAGAEVLFAPSYLDADSVQLEQSRELGMQIPFLGPDSWDPSLMTHFADLQAVYLVTQWNPAIGTAEAERFVAGFAARYGKQPGATAAFTYDAMMILADAIARAGTVEPEPLRAALAATVHTGATGVTSFPNGGDPRRSALIVRATSQGAEVVDQVHP